jgi:hypothetical protein
MEPTFYIARGKQKTGPFSLGHLKQMAGAGELRPADMVLQDGTGKWTAASAIEGVFPIAQLEPVKAESVPVEAGTKAVSEISAAVGVANEQKQENDEPPLLRRGVIFGVLAIPILIGACWLLADFLFASASSSWPSVAGTVEKCEIRQIVKTRSTQYKVAMVYSYQVEQKRYSGERFNTRENYLSGEEDAKRVAASFAPGAECRIFYDPSDPAQSVIETGRTWHAWARLALGVVGVLVVLLLGYLAIAEFRAFANRKRRTG